MEKKVYKEIKTEILSINLSNGKGGIRKKIQGRATKTDIEFYNQFAEEWGFNSRDQLFNTILDLTLRYCSPLPTDDMFTADMASFYNKFFCLVEDIEIYRQEQKGAVVGMNRHELKLYFLFMLQPFSDERIKKEDWKKKDKLLKKYNYGKTMFQILTFILSRLLTSERINRTFLERDRKRNENSTTINDQFNDIAVNKEEMDTTKGKYNI